MSPVLPGVIADGRDELTPEEAEQFVESQAQTYFGLSVSEFVRRVEAGELPGDDPDVMHLALLTGARIHSC